MIQGRVETLYSDKTKQMAIFPRTKVNAISDENGVGLEVLLATLSENQGDALPYYKIETSTDFNSLTDLGFYSIAAVGNTNIPTPDNHGMLISDNTVGTEYQLWMPDNGLAIYKRYMTADGWSEWATIADANGVVPVERGGTSSTTAAAAANKLLDRGTSNGDFNTKLDTGHMWTQLPSCTNTPHGDNPTGRYGHLEVIRSAGKGNVLQRWTNYNDGDTWVRCSNSSTSGDTIDWKPWSRLLDSNNYYRYALPLTGGKLTGELNINDKLKLWGDGEGGNIRFYLQDSTTNCFEFDGCNSDSLRLYYSTDNGTGATGFQQWKFGTNGTFTTGNSITAEKPTGNCSVKAISENGEIGLHVSTNSGVYDFGQSKWIIATDKARTKVYSGYPIYGAVWNDYAEFRNQNESIEPGYCVTSSRDGKVSKTNKRMQYCEGIVSDTFGFAIGETDECNTPLAVSGRVLAYYSGDIDAYEVGDAVCADADGKICKMTREEIREWPDRIVGTVSEFPTYETWGERNVSTAGRIWIKIK